MLLDRSVGHSVMFRPDLANEAVFVRACVCAGVLLHIGAHACVCTRACVLVELCILDVCLSCMFSVYVWVCVRLVGVIVHACLQICMFEIHPSICIDSSK